MAIAERLGIPAPGTYPSPALLRRWKSMPPWQAKRARAAWWREHGQQDGQGASEAVAPPEVPATERRASTRLSNDELARRRARRVEVDDPAFDGPLTDEDVSIASPATVTKWMNSGKSHRELGAPPPQRQYGSRN
jgi:hypothetical protein